MHRLSAILNEYGNVLEQRYASSFVFRKYRRARSIDFVILIFLIFRKAVRTHQLFASVESACKRGLLRLKDVSAELMYKTFACLYFIKL